MNPTPPPNQTCKNPKCTRPFTLRSNKLFCSLRCKNKYHNDQSLDPHNPRVQISKRLKANDAILLRAYLLADPSKVTHEILEYEQYDFNYFTSQNLNPQTGQLISWIYSFGLEKNKDGKTYTIHVVTEEK
jgi:hypothetical protein